MSDLKIVELTIETKENVEPPNERLHAKNAIVYIRYKDKVQVCNHVNRIAIVRRTFIERKGCFNLVGKIQSSESILKRVRIRLCHVRLCIV